jgi:hypothetical protein
VGKAERDKGLRGEREVFHEFEDAGFTVRKLEGRGDNLVMIGDFVFHVETKRQETIHIQKWSRQAEEEAPDFATPLVVYRRSRDPWRVSLPLGRFIGLLS